ncbi:MAG TPA: bifunctional hydroxymethylpyrimidine kinase/phosphomethylpyrimidine kinase [Thermoanaerobaculia bacterium]|jgi:hydroxymethylpyrimidine/phosphomethylpyrimidine kinase|nr:bifunctional hydroxymethylpyrimidine kinase/phosphomethylpyrimidine kinase [Thermoanaerobaculia bacterium]
MSTRTPPRLLTIAGSDSGGGAGIQADLKTFAAHGAYGMSAITALTAQNTVGVRAVHEVPPEVVAAQIDAVFEDIGVDAVKIGMLASAPIVRAVADRLRFWKPTRVVLDPVMVAKSGDALLRDDAVEALLEELVPLCTVVTPNLPELERMTGMPASEGNSQAAAEELSKRGPAVLAKGGHAEGQEVVDLLVVDGKAHRFLHRRLATFSTHGTGCTLSSAIAARLGRGEDLPRAVGGAIEYLQGAMKAAYPLGSGHGPVNHFWREA